MQKSDIFLSFMRSCVFDRDFQQRHRTKSSAFSRDRKLTFPRVILFLIQKSVKPLQIALNELFDRVDATCLSVSASAFSQARVKLAHTAFIELNKSGVVDTLYGDADYRTWRGFRVLAVDGSTIILPDSASVREEFGAIRIANQHMSVTGDRCCGLASVLYDVLNRVVINSILAPARAYEVDLAIDHLKDVDPTRDLLVFDRYYPSYRYLATLTKAGVPFVGRCSNRSCAPANKMFNTSTRSSRVVTLTPPHDKRRQTEEANLPSSLRVRFVRVELENGEIEVLVTSLIDEKLYDLSALRELYRLRWGVETFFDVIKNRLSLENFTGKSAEAVKQDFYSTIFLSGVETLLVGTAQKELDSRTSQNPQKVNKTVAFNTIKNHALDLFFSDMDIEELNTKLTNLFLTSPVCVRPKRNPTRSKTTDRARANYYKRVKKHAF